jgi:hypothetical protein
VVLGRGKRLFAGDAAPAAFELVSSTATPSGVVLSRYARAGAVTTGNFQLEPPTEAERERRRTLR